jgi:hypothetical protein
MHLTIDLNGSPDEIAEQLRAYALVTQDPLQVLGQAEHLEETLDDLDRARSEIDRLKQQIELLTGQLHTDELLMAGLREQLAAKDSPAPAASAGSPPVPTTGQDAGDVVPCKGSPGPEDLLDECGKPSVETIGGIGLCAPCAVREREIIAEEDAEEKEESDQAANAAADTRVDGAGPPDSPEGEKAAEEKTTDVGAIAAPGPGETGPASSGAGETTEDEALRWGRVPPNGAWHLWRGQNVGEAECGETTDAEIYFVQPGDRPDPDQTCLDCAATIGMILPEQSPQEPQERTRPLEDYCGCGQEYRKGGWSGKTRRTTSSAGSIDHGEQCVRAPAGIDEDVERVRDAAGKRACAKCHQPTKQPKVGNDSETSAAWGVWAGKTLCRSCTEEVRPRCKGFNKSAGVQCASVPKRGSAFCGKHRKKTAPVENPAEVSSA